MGLVHSILVTTDFSDTANGAVEYACKLAGDMGSDLHLLHVVTPQLAYGDFPEMLAPIEDVTPELIEASKERFAQLLATLPEDLTIHAHVEQASTSTPHAICAVAANLSVDLIVIGSHGYEGLMHALLGSTAEHVVRSAHCPVLVYKNPKR